MKKRSNLLKFILVSACCISTVFSQSAFTGQAAEIQEESYESSDESEESDDEVITPHYSEESKGEGDKYTSEEEWVPEGLEQKVIQGEGLDDNKSIVYLIMPDGFIDSEEDKAKFESEAAAMMEYLMKLCPYNEFKDVTKAYTIYTPSNESGASRDMDYEDYIDALNNGGAIPTKDTFFRCAFNQLSEYGDYERLLEPSVAGMQRADDVAKGYNINYDQIIIISNSTRYGGSGNSAAWPAYHPEKGDGSGTVEVPSINLAVSSINSASKEVVAHETAHALGNLADEYWAGAYFAEELANMTQDNNPETIRWKDFLTYSDNTGCGIYSYEEVAYGDPEGANWFRPTNGKCKMELLNTETVDYEFCEVCREGFRESMSAFSDCTTIYWQDYCKNSIPVNAEKNTLDHSGYTTDFVYSGAAPEDIENSFIVRHDGQVVEDPEITFTYYDSENNRLDAAPSDCGTYTVKASFKAPARSEMNDCEVTKAYTISKAPLTVTANDQTVEQGKELPEATYTITGFVGSDDESVLADSTLKAEYTVENTSELGISAIHMTGTATSANYELTLQDGTLTVTEVSTQPASGTATTSGTTPPKTGDESTPTLWLCLLLASLVAAAEGLRLRRKC